MAQGVGPGGGFVGPGTGFVGPPVTPAVGASFSATLTAAASISAALSFISALGATLTASATLGATLSSSPCYGSLRTPLVATLGSLSTADGASGYYLRTALTPASDNLIESSPCH